MTVLNTGATKKYTEGWQAIFSGKKSATQTARSAKKKAVAGPKSAAVKKSAKKAPARKKAGK